MAKFGAGRGVPPAAWVLIAIVTLGVVASTSSCISGLKSLLRVQEGWINQNEEGNKYFHSSSARLRDLQGKTISNAYQNQWNTLNSNLNEGKSVSVGDLRDLLVDQNALENHWSGDRSSISNEIRNKIARGEYVSQEDRDRYINSRGYYRNGGESYYFSKDTDEYSISEFDDRVSQRMPESYSRHGLNQMQPSRDEMRRGVSLDKSFSDEFAHSRPSSASSSPLLGDTHLSSNSAPGTYMLSESPSTANMASLDKPASSLKLPASDDPYALEGISRSQIASGDEDKYILKSKIVPPVCPACPNTCPKEKGECPPCPPCERCPEPDVECKRVPTYKTTKSKNYPMPVLSDFSQFGM